MGPASGWSGGHGNQQDSQGTLCIFREPVVPDTPLHPQDLGDNDTEDEEEEEEEEEADVAAAKLRCAEELLLKTAINASLEKPAHRSSSQPSSKCSIRPLTSEPTSLSQPEVCPECAWQSTPARLNSVYVQARVTRASTEKGQAGRPKRIAKRR